MTNNSLKMKCVIFGSVMESNNKERLRRSKTSRG